MKRFQVGTAFNYTLLKNENSSSEGWLYSNIGAEEFNIMTESDACNMYSIAQSFNESEWDYTKCLFMLKFSFDQSLGPRVNSLLWGADSSQHPEWIRKENNATKMEEFMGQYIRRTMFMLSLNVKEFYPVDSWVVVKDSVSDLNNQTLNTSPFSIVDDYVCKAFKIAREQLDEDSTLEYNDYGHASVIGVEKEKSDKVFAMVKDLKDRGCMDEDDGVGFTMHVDLEYNTTFIALSGIGDNLKRYAQNNLYTFFSEVDVRCNNNPHLMCH